MAKKDNRTRNWTFILYPESCVKDFKKVISDMHIEAVLSPLHDKDIDPTGEPKKPHYHVMMCFPGNKSFDQMNDISKSLGGTFPQPVLNTRSMTRYFIHMDNPDKYQYSRFEMLSWGGVDIDEMLKPVKALRYQCISEMTDYIIEHNITEFSALFIYARKNRYDDWFQYLCDNSAVVINSFISSLRNQNKRVAAVPNDNRLFQVDENGELVQVGELI